MRKQINLYIYIYIIIYTYMRECVCVYICICIEENVQNMGLKVMGFCCTVVKDVCAAQQLMSTGIEAGWPGKVPQHFHMPAIRISF